jgi:hypothetical protein
MYGTDLQELEQLMMLVPNYMPRRSGVIVVKKVENITGMFMVAGMIYGYSDPKDHIVKTEHYKRIQYLAKEFEEKNRSIICRELLG